jgi:hypothetical protein
MMLEISPCSITFSRFAAWIGFYRRTFFRYTSSICLWRRVVFRLFSVLEYDPFKVCLTKIIHLRSSKLEDSYTRLRHRFLHEADKFESRHSHEDTGPCLTGGQFSTEVWDGLGSWVPGLNVGTIIPIKFTATIQFSIKLIGLRDRPACGYWSCFLLAGFSNWGLGGLGRVQRMWPDANKYPCSPSSLDIADRFESWYLACGCWPWFSSSRFFNWGLGRLGCAPGLIACGHDCAPQIKVPACHEKRTKYHRQLSSRYVWIINTHLN